MCCNQYYSRNHNAFPILGISVTDMATEMITVIPHFMFKLVQDKQSVSKIKLNFESFMWAKLNAEFTFIFTVWLTNVFI